MGACLARKYATVGERLLFTGETKQSYAVDRSAHVRSNKFPAAELSDPNGPSAPRIQVPRGPKCPRGQRVPLSREARRLRARKSDDPPSTPAAGLTDPPPFSPPFPPPPQTSVQLPPADHHSFRPSRAHVLEGPRARGPQTPSFESGPAPSEPKCSCVERRQAHRNPRAHSPSATTLPATSPVTAFAAPPLLPDPVFDGNPR